MEQLITEIGELHPEDLQKFLDNYDIDNVDTFITFLYDLDEDSVEEVISEIHFNKQNL